ncbi:MAG: M48 family metalloprotease [Acidobacteriota bacterium]|nr:M48 family metalloprotease [Acidobacteriota bacterium]
MVTCLMLALLLLLNTAASLTASAFWKVIKNFAGELPAQNRARLIFSLRTLPLITALLFVCAFLLPSYFLFEPIASDETVSLKLAMLALISAVGVVLALSRVFATWWRTRRLIKEWTRNGEPMVVSNVNLPVYCFRHPFPVIAVVGIVRPRIFVAEQIFHLLKDEEFAAAIVHEFGHLAARDNFKRAFLRVCRDLLILPIGKTLDRIWAETAEAAADEYALSTGGSRTALNLAAALVKIARAIPENTKPAMPLAAFLVDEQTDISWRVRQLVRLTEGKNDFARRKLNFSIYLWCGFAVLALPILGLATDYDFLSKVHRVTESVVAILQ